MLELVPWSVVPAKDDWVPVMVDPDLPPMACHAGDLNLHHGESIVVETADGSFLGGSRSSPFPAPSRGWPWWA